MKRIIICLLALAFAMPLYSQKDLEKELNGYHNPDELVTLSENVPFSKAVEILSKVSIKTTGKTIVSTASVNTPIGVEIVSQPYKKALTIITQYAGLIYDETQDAIVIRGRNDAKGEQKPNDIYAPVDSREVKISAVFFEANISEMKSRGINWQFLLSQKNLSLGADSRTFGQSAGSSSTDGTGTTSTQKSPDFNLSGAASNFGVGGFTGAATAMFRFFETENLGEIIASPNVSVRSGQKGRIQIGSDFSIKTKDFSGNVIDKFYPTGTIIEVTPYIYREDNLDYVLLNLNVERSSAVPSEISTEIRKTSASTQVMMLNGEETIIGGLFINDQTNDRTGIPILKDLPWWVFGIRYLTGSDQKINQKKEVVILIKTELMPSLKERLTMPKDGNKIQQEVEKNRQQIKFYQFNQNQQEEK
ncbi:MAG: type II secretion system protein GspD [Syntrophomonadaceae bacterium]